VGIIRDIGAALLGGQQKCLKCLKFKVPKVEVRLWRYSFKKDKLSLANSIGTQNG